MDQETMQQQFKKHGFKNWEFLGNSTYRLNFLSDVIGDSYPLYVKIVPSEKGGLLIHFEEDYFEENVTVPLKVRSEALDKLKKINLQPVQKDDNGSMAQNLDEMKKLGKEMSTMKTGSQQLEEDNKTPDPIQ